MRNTIYSIKYFLISAVILVFSNPVTSANDYEKIIDNWCDSVLSNTKLPGIEIGVWAPGKVDYMKAKGISNIEKGLEMNLKNKFRIGSTTKPFVVTVLLQLVDEKRLALDDSISKFFPDFPNGSKITVRMLANMTSGIFNYSETEAFNDSVTNHPLKQWAPGELVQVALYGKPYFEPGKGFHYANTNTILIGMIIEKLTQNKLQYEIENRLLKPLGMNNTSFPEIGNILPEPGCHGYSFDSTGSLTDCSEHYDVSWVWAAGAMISTLEDMKIWAEALATGKMISAELQKERLVWVEIEGSPVKYGLGLFTLAGFIGHNGGLPGYTNITVHDSVNKATIVVFYNTENDKIKPESMVGKIAELLYGLR
jgi:D-alanyl-D-alanine carboxypeptidase